MQEPFPPLTFHSTVILSIPFTVVERMSGSNSGAEIKTKILKPKLVCSVSYGVMVDIIVSYYMVLREIPGNCTV